MNEVIKVLEERRSVRKYKKDMIPDEVIDEILKAGTYAATGMNRQAPIIIAIKDKATRDKLMKLNRKIFKIPFICSSVFFGKTILAPTAFAQSIDEPPPNAMSAVQLLAM